jgi:small subunit ribosomal protein S8e
MNKGRKISGGKYHRNRKKKLYERQGQEKHVILGDNKIKTLRTRGGNLKTMTLKANTVNITLKGKTSKAEITNVVETPQNKFFARQNRLMKGAIIDTSLGKARITNRPTQEGCVNAVLIEKK